MEKLINSRSVQKHDIEANWLKAVNFIPKQGELIIYDIEVDDNGTLETPQGRTEPYLFERFKIGDGMTNVNDLPFAAVAALEETLQALQEEVDGKLPLTGGVITDASDYMSTIPALEVQMYKSSHKTAHIKLSYPPNMGGSPNSGIEFDRMGILGARVEQSGLYWLPLYDENAPFYGYKVLTTKDELKAGETKQTPSTSLLRNSSILSADTDPTVNGEICWTYK